MSEKGAFPKYLMKIDRSRHFLTLEEVMATMNCGFLIVSFGRYVLSEDFSVRKMTNEDRKEIREKAAQFDDGK